MTSTPIADAVNTERGPAREAPHIEEPISDHVDFSKSSQRVWADDARGLVSNINRSAAGYPIMPGYQESADHMLNLVNAQQVLIQAQHQALHDANISALAAAQHGFIVAQAAVLERLGVFGT